MARIHMLSPSRTFCCASPSVFFPRTVAKATRALNPAHKRSITSSRLLVGFTENQVSNKHYATNRCSASDWQRRETPNVGHNRPELPIQKADIVKRGSDLRKAARTGGAAWVSKPTETVEKGVRGIGLADSWRRRAPEDAPRIRPARPAGPAVEDCMPRQPW